MKLLRACAHKLDGAVVARVGMRWEDEARVPRRRRNRGSADHGRQWRARHQTRRRLEVVHTRGRRARREGGRGTVTLAAHRLAAWGLARALNIICKLRGAERDNSGHTGSRVRPDSEQVSVRVLTRHGCGWGEPRDNRSLRGLRRPLRAVDVLDEIRVRREAASVRGDDESGVVRARGEVGRDKQIWHKGVARVHRERKAHHVVARAKIELEKRCGAVGVLERDEHILRRLFAVRAKCEHVDRVRRKERRHRVAVIRGGVVTQQGARRARVEARREREPDERVRVLEIERVRRQQHGIRADVFTRHVGVRSDAAHHGAVERRAEDAHQKGVAAERNKRVRVFVARHVVDHRNVAPHCVCGHVGHVHRAQLGERAVATRGRAARKRVQRLRIRCRRDSQNEERILVRAWPRPVNKQRCRCSILGRNGHDVAVRRRNQIVLGHEHQRRGAVVLRHDSEPLETTRVASDSESGRQRRRHECARGARERDDQREHENGDLHEARRALFELDE
eukprot:Amastigsp_a847190_26.p2 type:complete len:508 gc:universal Amastigsp_a847190_26:630-2153(+)